MMRLLTVTVTLTLAYRDGLTQDEVLTDLHNQLDGAGRNIPHGERQPYRYQECGWWTHHRDTVEIVRDEPA